MAPSIAELHQQAQRHLNSGAMGPMVDCCKAILDQQQDFADAWFLLSVAAENAGDLPRALAMRERAVGLAPDSPEYLAQQARILSRCNRSRDALASARAALAAEPSDALTLDTLGVVLTRLGRYEEAYTALSSAVDLAPARTQYHFNLAAAAQFLGRQETAETHYRTAIRLSPKFARAWWALSELHKDGEPSGDLETLEPLADDPSLSPQDRLYLGHAIAREHELAGNFDQAFERLTWGKHAARNKALSSSARDAENVSALHRAFTDPDSTIQVAPDGASVPLFIVGMPRTGTTLVERILDSHDAVESLGELQDFAHAVRQSANPGGKGILNPTVINEALAADPAAIADLYRKATATRREKDAGQGRYIIDKMPLNALYIGFILRAMPTARIVLLQRDPRDVCLSNYRQLFAVDYSYYDYHYDLGCTAQFVARFEHLMRHWQSLYGNRLFVLSYEDLVTDPEREVRSLLAYLDLPWDPRCLEFHKRDTGVATPSALQVRQPLYRGAVARWRHYEKALEPATAILRSAGLLPQGRVNAREG